MKKLTSLLFALALMLSAFSLTATAKSSSVKVQIAPFYTQINDISIYNSGVKYPLILYKDVTYIPLTYYLSIELGLVSGYDSDEGFYIVRDPSGVDETLLPENPIDLFGGYAKNSYGKQYDAVIPDYPVYLCGRNINDINSEYPVLNFRDITYLPMTYEIAVDELNFNLRWSYEQYSLYIDSYNGMNGGIYLTDMSEEKMNFQKLVTVYREYLHDEKTGAMGYERLYDYYAQYTFDAEKDELLTLENTSVPQEIKYTDARGGIDSTAIDIEIGGGKLYFDELELCPLPDGYNSAKGKKYIDDEKVFVLATVSNNTVPSRYVPRKEFLFAVDGNKATLLSQWDSSKSLSGIYKGADGAYYMSFNSHSHFGSVRYENYFSFVLKYTDDGSIRNITEDYGFGSLSVVGAYDGKLYVRAINYYNSANSLGLENFSYDPVHSGYYVIDTKNGGKMSKLYPYISGELFVGYDGSLYCITDYAKNQKLVNLNTGKMYEFK